MSRFAIDAAALVYLPPTMSPCETSDQQDFLEFPTEAFSYFARNAVPVVMCEEKHMGSRAVVKVHADGTGAVHTRTGRAFFDNETSALFLSEVAQAFSNAGLWQSLSTDWILLDAEIMPWSAKALALIKSQYAAVGAAARESLPVAQRLLNQAADRGIELGDLADRTESRLSNANAFTAAYRHYCWTTAGVDGLRIAPFQVLATNGATYENRDHAWHLSVADALVEADPGLFTSTRRLLVNTGDPESLSTGVDWWLELTASGGEGMVVKPLANLSRGPKGLVQPGIKVRGREYLRIIYGPDYLEPENLIRLRNRNLAHKRSMAAREYALGLEALRRATANEPLWRVHECVFAILALESEPVDPRL